MLINYLLKETGLFNNYYYVKNIIGQLGNRLTTAVVSVVGSKPLQVNYVLV